MRDSWVMKDMSRRQKQISKHFNQRSMRYRSEHFIVCRLILDFLDFISQAEPIISDRCTQTKTIRTTTQSSSKLEVHFSTFHLLRTSSGNWPFLSVKILLIGAYPTLQAHKRVHPDKFCEGVIEMVLFFLWGYHLEQDAI